MLTLNPYKGYDGYVIEIDAEADLITGLVSDIQDVINFQARTPSELQAAFEGSVDAYLAHCLERGEEPNRPFSGQFVTRVSPEEHKAIHRAARVAGKSLNAWVRDALVVASSSVERLVTYEKEPAKAKRSAAAK